MVIKTILIVLIYRDSNKIGYNVLLNEVNC